MSSDRVAPRSPVVRQLRQPKRGALPSIPIQQGRSCSRGNRAAGVDHRHSGNAALRRHRGFLCGTGRDVATNKCPIFSGVDPVFDRHPRIRRYRTEGDISARCPTSARRSQRARSGRRAGRGRRSLRETRHWGSGVPTERIGHSRLRRLVAGARLTRVAPLTGVEVLVHPGPDQIARQAMVTCQAVERFAGKIFLNDLALERDSWGSVLCQGVNPLDLGLSLARQVHGFTTGGAPTQQGKTATRQARTPRS